MKKIIIVGLCLLLVGCSTTYNEKHFFERRRTLYDQFHKGFDGPLTDCESFKEEYDIRIDCLDSPEITGIYVLNILDSSNEICNQAMIPIYDEELKTGKIKQFNITTTC